MWEIANEHGYDRYEHIVMRNKGVKLRPPAQPVNTNVLKYNFPDSVQPEGMGCPLNDKLAIDYDIEEEDDDVDDENLDEQ